MKRRILELCLVAGVGALLILVGAGCDNKGSASPPSKAGGNGPIPSGTGSYPGGPGGGGPGGGGSYPGGGGPGGSR